MKKSINLLKILRVTLAVIMFSLLTFFFVDFTNSLSSKWHVLAHIQFIPAVLNGALAGILIAAAIILLTLLFGRIYCSVICPMGVFQDIAAWFSKKIGGKKKKYSYSKPKTVLRWSVLAVLILSAITIGFSGYFNPVSLLEPYSAFGRMATHIFRPIYQFGNNILEAIFTSFGDYTFYKSEIFFNLTSFLVAIITFFGIGFFAFRNGRTFCNTLCPTGTILGFASKFSLFKIRIDTEKCNSCGLCAAKCKAACINSKEHKIDYSRCVDCFDCLGSCKKNALGFSVKKKEVKEVRGVKEVREVIEVKEKVDADKRKFIATGLFTALSLPTLLAQGKEIILKGGQKIRTRKTPLSPPGSQSHEHLLKKCTACHLCISRCPSKVLKPAFAEYGLAGMMMPTMKFDDGFCNYSCTECSSVCPNGALLPLTKEQKKATQMGKVQFNRDICVVVQQEHNCGACSEHCPTQAVKMMPYKDGLTIPTINTDLCIGCGGCEFICPVRPERAIFIEGNEKHEEAKVQQEGKVEKIVIDGFGF
ncbi:MAG: 4Fe-4S dicluster domain-containing protein [Prevotellaceae bacterium]|jgi:polyferredoxin|nr:4Fe-4S dicluster domain-containing protein [Prevotellaceae bacterium]